MLNIKRNINEIAPYLIEKIGYLINPLILNFTNEKNQLLIFYFHGLYASKAEKELNHIDPQNNLTVNQFADFIDYFLHHNYHFIKPGDLLEELQADKRYIMLTFDDGYLNNTLAIEILNKYKTPATFFIIAKNVLENKSYWWDIIYKYRTKEGISLKTVRKEQAHLKSFKYDYIENYIEHNFGKKSSEPWSDIDRPLNPQELKELAKNPFATIGNHTYNHSILTNYSTEVIKEELSLCNRILFEITGIAPNITAFPNGNFNDRVIKAAEEIGFQFAFTIENKLNILPISNNNITCLNRFMVRPINIKNYGSLNRLGYSPGSLYFDLKKRLKFYKIR